MEGQEQYDPSVIEARWQQRWLAAGAFRADDGGTKPKSYLLFEFPYPSGDGLHVGHLRPYCCLDALARRQRLQGKNVLFPIGWDAFGLPTENYALKTGVHPRVATDRNIATFKRQMQSLGLSLDWSREIDTTDPTYYRWTQWLFLQFFKKGLAYQAEMPINWCPKDKIGLANEEVVAGKCERCGTAVERRRQKQWMLKITAYADRLLKDLDTVDYLEKIKTQQVNWIGRSEGAEIVFSVVAPRRYVLLHGYNGSAAGIFFPWLKRELEKTGAEVIALDLPNPTNPTEAEQVAFVLKNVSFDEETVLFGHSLGAVVALKVLEKLKKPIAGLVLAGGFTEAKFKDKPRPFQSTFSWEFDFRAIRKKVTGPVTVLRADRDYAVPAGATAELAAGFGVPVTDVHVNEPHFTAAEEPTILEALNPSIRVFTTRPDTLFGATYLVLAPEHPLVQQVARSEYRRAVENYVKKAAAKSDLERTDLAKEKTGVFTGAYATNPVNDEKIPIWVADYVLLTYGTGAIMAVPAHDERDNEFAKKFHLPIRPVIQPPPVVGQAVTEAAVVSPGAYGHLSNEIEHRLWTGDGTMTNSGEYDHMENRAAGQKIVAALQSNGHGQPAVQYKLRDWVFSRQHYWGEPIPVVHCAQDGVVPVPEDQLPVELPHVEQYQPTDTGASPLATITDWVNTTCPTCGGAAKRETDTMPNWAGSSWYFLRYTDPHNDRAFADRKKLDYWLPVDVYDGGMEHTVLHLLYSRFWHKFLFDQGLVPTPEPYQHRHSHGVVLAPDGQKMSKSRGNVINPDSLVAQYGADSVRVYEMFMGPFEDAIPWSTQGMVGVRRFLDRLWRMQEKLTDDPPTADVQRAVAQAVKKVGSDLDAFRFNTAVSALMILSNTLDREVAVPKSSFVTLLTVLLPFAPHLASELLERSRPGAAEQATWPVVADADLVADIVEYVVQVAGRKRATLRLSPTASEAEATTAALALPAVAKYCPSQPQRVVFVPGRLINIIP